MERSAISLEPTNRPQCPDCKRGVGLSHCPVIVTGVVACHPCEPDGRDYRQCATCKRFVRCQIVDRRRQPRVEKLPSVPVAA